MKGKAIISLMLIAMMVLSVTIAFADSQTWTPASTISTSNGWTLMTGSFGGMMIPAEGAFANGNRYANAGHLIPNSSDGNFSLSITFKYNNASQNVFVGLSTSNTTSDQGSWWVIGNTPGFPFKLSHSGSDTVQSFNGPAPATGTYTATITSTDGGRNTTYSISGGNLGSTRSITRTERITPREVIIHINNNGTNGAFDRTPVITGISYTYTTPSSTPTPNPSGSPTPVPNTTTGGLSAAYLQSIRDYYASQPVVHMSNQSVVYNPDGTIKQVITGNQTNATATPTVTPAATTKPNATATPVPANVTAKPVASAPAATKTQSPGFEMVLAAIGMMSALVLITRKKK